MKRRKDRRDEAYNYLSQLFCKGAWRYNMKIRTGYFNVLPSIGMVWVSKTANSQSPSWKQRGISRLQTASLNNSDITEEVRSKKFTHILIYDRSLPSLQIQATSLQSTHSSYYTPLQQSRLKRGMAMERPPYAEETKRSYWEVGTGMESWGDKHAPERPGRGL